MKITQHTQCICDSINVAVSLQLAKMMMGIYYAQTYLAQGCSRHRKSVITFVSLQSFSDMQYTVFVKMQEGWIWRCLKITCITTTKHSKAKTVCIFLGVYCILCVMSSSLIYWVLHKMAANSDHIFNCISRITSLLRVLNLLSMLKNGIVCGNGLVLKRRLAIARDKI